MAPWDQVLSKWKSGSLHSGSKKGPLVKSKGQALAIMLAEKRKSSGKPEYRKRSGLASALGKR